MVKENGGEPQDQFELAPAKTVNLLQERDIQKMFVCTHLLNFTRHVGTAGICSNITTGLHDCIWSVTDDALVLFSDKRSSCKYSFYLQYS